MMKQMARKRKESVGDDQFGNDDEPKLLLPQMAQIETKSYRPGKQLNIKFYHLHIHDIYLLAVSLILDMIKLKTGST